MDVEVNPENNLEQETIMRFGHFEIPATDLEAMEREDLVALFLRNGFSRVTAERVFEVQRAGGTAGRARVHTMSRVWSARH